MLLLPSLHLFSVKKPSGVLGEKKSQLRAESPLQASWGLCMDGLSSGRSRSTKLPSSSLLHRHNRSEHVLKHLTEPGSSSSLKVCSPCCNRVGVMLKYQGSGSQPSPPNNPG